MSAGAEGVVELGDLSDMADGSMHCFAAIGSTT